MNRVKTTTTSTGTGNIVVSATPATRCRPLSDVAAGKVARILIEDESGTDWELVNATIIDATSFSRGTVINGSAGPGVKVNFSAGTKTVFVAAVLVDPSIPFNATIPLDRPEIAYMAPFTMTGPLTLTAGANPVDGAHVVATIIGDGTNDLVISGAVKHASSLPFNKTAGAKNIAQFLRTPGVTRYSISQAAADVVATVPATPTATTVTMTGPTGGVVNTASGNFIVGTDAARSASVVITPTPVTGVTFNPTSVTLPAGSATATFTATPTTTGTKTIAVTNNAGLANPPAFTYTAASASSTVSGVTVSPATANVAGDATQQFTATVAGTNSPSQALNWGASGGTITTGGLFTAPAATGSAQTITITATSAQDSSKSGTATVTVAAAVATVYDTLSSPYGGTTASGTSPKTYTAGSTAGQIDYGWGGLWDKHFAAGVDGSFQFKITANNFIWEIQLNSLSTQYAHFDSRVVVGNPASFYEFSTDNGANAIGTPTKTASVAAANGDIFKCVRTGSAGALNTATIKFYVSKNNGASFSEIISVANAPTGVLYPFWAVDGRSQQITELQSTGLVAN